MKIKSVLEVIERIYNEDTTCEDIDFILECKS